MTRSTLLTALHACCLLGLTLGSGCSKESESSSGVEVAPGPEGAMLSAPANTLGRYRIAETRETQVEASLELEAGASVGTPSRTIELTGQLRRTPVAFERNSAIVAVELVSPKVQLASRALVPIPGEDEEGTRRLERDLSRRVYARFERGGELKELLTPPETTALAREVVTQVVANVQFVVHEAGATSWEITEWDEAGEYRATYSQTRSGAYIKKKLRYVSGATGPVTLEHFAAEVRVSPSGWPESYEVEEQLATSLAGSETYAAATSLVLSLSRPRLSRSTELPAVYLEQRPQLEAHSVGKPPPAEGSTSESLARALLGPHTEEGLTSELTAYANATAEERQRSRGALAERTAALLLLQPDVVARVRDALPAKSSVERAVLVHALGECGTAPCRDALYSLLEQKPPLPDESVASVLAQLTRGRHARDGAEKPLLALTRSRNAEVASAARAVLGVLASSLPPEDERRSKLVASLHRGVETAPSDEVRRQWLAAIGVAADPSSVPALRDLIRTSSTKIGVPAIGALRFITGDEAQALLLETLTGRGAARRIAAIDAIRMRSPGPYADALVKLATSDQNEGVRTAAVKALGRNLVALPKLRGALEKVKESDKSPQLQAAARLLLDR